MKPAIHYAFEARLIKGINNNKEFEFIEIFKEFFDDEPIKAREAAFRHYQNYIDVLLDSKSLSYKSDEQTREDLVSFYDPKISMGIGKDVPDSYGIGIGVYMMIDEEFDNPEISVDREIIHGIGEIWPGSWDPVAIALSLEREVEFYKHYNYNTSSYLTNIVFCNKYNWLDGHRIDEPRSYTILETPFDWTGLDKPYWWNDYQEEEKIETILSESFEKLISGGEIDQVEFKPSLLYNFKTRAASIGVKGIIAKTICAFLNSIGGYLFIGIDNGGQVQGLSHDFSLAIGKNPKDYFQLEFDDMIFQFLPQFIKDKIIGRFIEINGTELFVVIVFPSKKGPIFLKGKDGKEFWVRWTVSTRQYKDIEEIANYCIEHWTSKD